MTDPAAEDKLCKLCLMRHAQLPCEATVELVKQGTTELNSVMRNKKTADNSNSFIFIKTQTLVQSEATIRNISLEISDRSLQMFAARGFKQFGCSCLEQESVYLQTASTFLFVVKTDSIRAACGCRHRCGGKQHNVLCLCGRRCLF